MNRGSSINGSELERQHSLHSTPSPQHTEIDSVSLRPNSITLSISRPAREQVYGQLASIMEYGLNRSATRFELSRHVEMARTCLQQIGNQVCDLDSVMEFGPYCMPAFSGIGLQLVFLTWFQLSLFNRSIASIANKATVQFKCCKRSSALSTSCGDRAWSIDRDATKKS